MKKNTDISERIKEMIDSLEVTPNEFARKIGYNRSQTVYDVLNGKSSPSYDFFKKLLNSEYSVIIDVEWLITGKGDMLKRQKVTTTVEDESFNSHDPDFVDTLKELVDSQKEVIRMLKNHIAQLKKEKEEAKKAPVNSK